MKIIDTDLFLDMPASTQMLYFHLCMRADDDGFISNPKRVQRMIGASDDDIKLLVAKQFIIPFESGVCVIKHWRVHNYIQKDRYTATFQKYEREMLNIDESGAYELDTECIQDASKMLPQVRVRDRDRLGKNRDNINSESKEPNEPHKKQEEEKIKYADYVYMKPSEYTKLIQQYGEALTKDKIEDLSLWKGSKGKKTKSDYLTIITWIKKDKKEGGTNGKYSNNNQPNKQSQDEGTGGMSEESKRLLELARQRGHLDNLKDPDIDF